MTPAEHAKAIERAVEIYSRDFAIYCDTQALTDFRVCSVSLATLQAAIQAGVGAPAQPVTWQVNHIADHVADNWPMRKYDLAEIEQRLRGIPAAPQPAAPAQPSAQALDSVRVFWQQHTKSDALSMTMTELHADVELVIRAARGSAQAAPVDAAVKQDAERLDFMIESCTQVATISPSGRKYLCYPDGRMQAGSYPTARAAIDAAAQKGTND